MSYRLTSTPMVFTPGIVNYLRRMADEGESQRARAILEGAFESLPASAINRLLTGDYVIDGETVVVKA